MPHPYRTLRSREVYRNAWLRLREDIIERPRAGRGIYSVVERLDALAVVARDAAGRIYLVHQYRYPVGQHSWELPSGTLEAGEEPLAAAQRELVEETGLTAARWALLGRWWLAPGFCNQLGHVYLAEALTQGASRPELVEEDLEVRAFHPDEITRMIRAGELLDGLTMIGVHLLELAERNEAAG